VSYARVDLAKHRAASDLFHSAAFRSAEIDTVVHLPRHGTAARGARTARGRALRTNRGDAAGRAALPRGESVCQLVALGSAFVYKLQPGNANRFTEESQLDLDPDVSAEIRSWIDADMIVHGEVHNERLRVVLLRAPTVVAAGGYAYMNPALPVAARARARSASTRSAR
jgi:hypothetical protein